VRFFLTQQFVKFVGVGVTAAAANWLSRAILNLWVTFPVAVTLSYPVGLASAFVMNHLYVFPNSTRPKALLVRDFVAINLAFFPIVWASSIYFERLLVQFVQAPYSEGLAHGLALAVPMVVTFTVYKFKIFVSK